MLPQYEKEFLKVDKILLRHLMEDRVSPDEYGLVHLYLNRVGGKQKTFDYAFLRMHKNMSRAKLIDIGFALMNSHEIDNQANFDKFFKRAESYICLTHEKLMKGKNLNGLIAICIAFEGAGKGTIEFWRKVEQLLEKEITQKRQPLDEEHALQLLAVLASKQILNEEVIQSILSDIGIHFEARSYGLPEIHSFVKSMDGLGLVS